MPLCKLLRASLAKGYIPSCWQGARVVFIPKACRVQHDLVKDLRHISLISFLDKFIKEVAVVYSPLHPEHHAYQEGKSTETALAEVVTEIEKEITKTSCSAGH